MTRTTRAVALATAIACSVGRAGAQSEPSAIVPSAEAPAPNVPNAEAKAEFEKGLAALRADRWQEAELHFRRSLELVPRPSTTYDLAYVLFRQGRPGESIALLEALERDRSPEADAYREFAAKLLPQVRADLQTEQPRVAPAKPVAVRPDAPPPPASSDSTPVAPWIVAGTGGALLIAGAVTGALALAADHDLNEKCPGNRDCDPSLESLQNRAVVLGTTTDVLLITGGVLVAGGLTWHFLLPSPGTGHNTAYFSVTGRY
jgi:tetratricopeptide (TPR) repeat protein